MFSDELGYLEKKYSNIIFGYKNNQDLLYYFMNFDDITKKIVLDLYTDFDGIQLQNNIISQVVGHLTNTVDCFKSPDKLTLPDFEEKLKFNNLSDEICSKLTLASYHIVIRDEYLDTYQNTYIKDDLKNIFTKLYNDAVIKYPDNSDSDKQFYFILEQSIPNDIKDNGNKLIFSQNILILMSKYFETCDIFKEPEMIMAFF